MTYVFKKDVRTNTSQTGFLRVECPKCGNRFFVSYLPNGVLKTPIPKICPFCKRKLAGREK